ncbi:MAG: histidine phosphatase family protein [Candidatus Promineifilaceae bacterium]|nr:histidine phosphatase family protein [Candidatus Promineifilaceae bacterium]
MDKLIFIRHSQSRPTPGQPASSWPLTSVGRERCQPLARWLSSHEPLTIVSSEERKAMETAQLAASQLGIPWSTASGLQEHDRTGEPYHSQEQFLALVERLFREPQATVFGRESGAQALARFEQALATVLRSRPPGNLAVVTHGTVLSLFVGAHSDHDPLSFWQRLRQPSIVVFSLPDLTLLEVVDEALF